MIIPLATTSFTTGQAAFTEYYTTQVTQEWLRDRDDYELVAVEANGDAVEVKISGDGSLPSTEDLTAALSKRTDKKLAINLVVIPSQQQSLLVNQ